MADGQWVLVKNAILRVDSGSGRVTAKCPRCKAWVDVPFRYMLLVINALQGWAARRAGA